MSLVWELLTKVALSEFKLILIPSSLSNHDQRLHVCRSPVLYPNTLAVAQWTYRRVDKRCLSLLADLEQHHARPGTLMSLSAKSSDSQ
jgi:hypothetical protein